jgi:hypothetical protein
MSVEGLELWSKGKEAGDAMKKLGSHALSSDWLA